MCDMGMDFRILSDCFLLERGTKKRCMHLQGFMLSTEPSMMTEGDSGLQITTNIL